MRQDRRSPEAEAYRKLYKTAQWRETRARQLAANPLCQSCQSIGRTTPAAICNHVDRESKKDPATFFAGPFTSECKPCHDGLIQRQEKRGHVIGSDAEGWPIDPKHPWNVRAS